MPSTRRSTRLAGISTMAFGATAGLLALGGVASAATGPNLLVNGNFNAGTAGATPTGWTAVTQGPADYASSFTDQTATSKYPVPAGGPDAAGDGAEDFYEGGNAGIAGGGASQSVAMVSQAADPQVTYSDAMTFYPGNTTWAFGGLEVSVVSAGTSYTLVYYNPIPQGGSATPTAAQVASATGTSPADTSLVALSALSTKGGWVTNGPRDLTSDLSAAFALSTYTVSSVTPIVLEDITADASPYPNITAYFEDISLAAGNVATPPSSVPEAPAAVALPLLGLAVVGGVTVVRRRRRA